jgi:hypothetical protein
MPFEDLFLRNVAVGFDRQLAVKEQIGDWAWSLDPRNALIEFSKKKLLGNRVRTSTVQILGSESKASSTWLWSWANESGFAHRALAAARRVKEIGEKEGVAEFTAASFQLGEVDGARLAVTGAAMFGAPGYFRCPYDGGATYVIIEDDSFSDPTTNRVQRISTVFPQLISQMSISNHRRAFEAYLTKYHLQVTSEDDHIVAKAEDGSSIIGRFDEQNRLVGLTADTVARSA